MYCVANQLRLSSCVHSRRVWAVCGSQSLFMTEINILPLPLPEPYIWYKKTILSARLVKNKIVLGIKMSPNRCQSTQLDELHRLPGFGRENFPLRGTPGENVV